MSDRALRRLARGLGALAALVLLLVGIPIALAVLVGWPLPHGLPSWNEFRSALTTSGPGDEVIVKGLAVVCWLAWATLAASVVLEVAGVIRGRGSRRVPFAGPVQALAANLVAAVVLTLPSVGVRTTPSATQPLAARLQAPTIKPIAAAPPPGLHEPDQPVLFVSATSDPATEVAGAEETYTVVRRDTLWGIAEVHLGDPFRWPELFALNQGRPQPDGRTLTDPNLIRPGWVLALPGGTSVPAQSAQPPTGAGSS
ncbi:MAG: LysM peptidoglycan-binding domain-containing protein, partial [Chloroflexota bacterium]